MKRMIQVALIIAFLLLLMYAGTSAYASAREAEPVEALGTPVRTARECTYSEYDEENAELPDIYTLSNVKEHKEEFEPYEKIPLSADLQEHLFTECESLNLNPWLMLALMESESSFIENSKGDWAEDGYGNLYFRSYGLMQINKVNWEWLSQAGIDVFESKGNITAGLLIFKKYETNSIEETIMNYKCGPTRAKQLREQGVVLGCVETIVNRAIELEQLNAR